jgi:hypothetical protein
VRRNCPICAVQTTGGRPCHYHKRSGHTAEQTARVRELYAIIAMFCDAIDEARIPLRGNRRTEYNRAYYYRNIERRRLQARESKRRNAGRRKLLRLRAKVLELAR